MKLGTQAPQLMEITSINRRPIAIKLYMAITIRNRIESEEAQQNFYFRPPFLFVQKIQRQPCKKYHSGFQKTVVKIE